MAYATLAEFKNQLNVTKSDTDLDTFLQKLLDTAEEIVDAAFGRTLDGFLADAVASDRYFTTRGGEFARIDECVEITGVQVKQGPTASEYKVWTSPATPYAGDGDWIPLTGDPTSPRFGKLPYTGLMIDPNGDYSAFSESGDGLPTMIVTGRWGYSDSVPEIIREVTIMQAARWYRTLRASMGASLATAEFTILKLRKTVDPDILELIRGSRLVRPVI